MLMPVERPSGISTLGFTIFIAWVPPKSEGLLQRYDAGCDATSGVRQKHLRAARPTENASETPAGRQADGKFTLSSRFALYFN
jgi:hypothetical protein